MDDNRPNARHFWNARHGGRRIEKTDLNMADVCSRLAWAVHPKRRTRRTRR